MKKILVVLLVLATATGVFAQGDWSLSGQAMFGTRLVINPDLGGGDAIMGGIGNFSPYHGYSATNGNLTIGYARDAINIGIMTQINAVNHANIGQFNSEATFTANGDNYKFVFQSNIFKMIQGTAYSADSNADDRKLYRLWGQYELLNQMVLLEAAFVSPDNERWVSDKTGVLPNAYMANTKFYWNTGDTYTKTDGKNGGWGENYLATQLSIAGLDIGLMIPNVFTYRGIDGTVYTVNGGAIGAATTDNQNSASMSGPGLFIDSTIMQSVFGAKFIMAPVEIAAQFKFQDAQIYFGGKFNAGPISVGLSFAGQFSGTDAAKNAAVGARVDFSGGAFGANLVGKFQLKGSGSSEKNNVVVLEPGFFYNVIPSHMQFRLDAGFYFFSQKAAGSTESNMDIQWGVQPQIVWNFLGTGAVNIDSNSGYYGLNTGMIIRYRMISDRNGVIPAAYAGVNALDIVFKMSI